MQIDLLTPIPAMAEGYLAQSMMKRAQDKGLVRIVLRNLRDWTTDRHRTVDDTPYGGGPGMVMKVEPIDRALADLRTAGSRVVFLTPQGRLFSQETAQRLAGEKHLILLCGHYEGVDQRVSDHLVDEEISIGDYVLTNGVLPALLVVDAVVRLIPGVLGDQESARQDSFSAGLLDHPHFTKPAEYRGWAVPAVLLSGDHRAIAQWRMEEARRRTAVMRPDLLARESPRPHT